MVKAGSRLFSISKTNIYHFFNNLLTLHQGAVNMAVSKQDLQDICTIAEVAAFLRVHRSTITRYAMRGELPSYVMGTRRLFKREEVLAFFDNLKDRTGIAFSETED